MPRPDPIRSPRLSLLRQFRRIMIWMAVFAIVVATIAVLLVARGETAALVHMMIAIALGAGLSVLLAGALMSLVFLSAHSGHDEAANRFEEDEQP
jgi:Na+/proline symporter